MKTARDIAEALCLIAEHDPDTIMGTTRGQKRDALLRWLAMWAYKNMTHPPRTYTAVGAAFGRDRTSVSGGLRRLKKFMSGTSQEAKELRELKEKLIKALA